MSDSWKITGNLPWNIGAPGPTQLELASYVIAADGIDVDFGALFKDTYSNNSIAEGGALAFDESDVRQFKFPLRLASSWPGPGGLNGLENYLRLLVRKPAHPSAGFIDLLPENATSAIRFDILDGRLSPRTYDPYRQRIGRRDADLVLDVKPFGYMPTEILLASVGLASNSVYALSWNQGSVIGDVPGLARIAIETELGPSWIANMNTDGLYWTLSNMGGTVLFTPSMIAAASLGAFQAGNPNAIWAASHQTDAMAPAGLMLKVGVSPTLMASTALQMGWGQLLRFTLNDSLTTRGRFRVLGFFRSEPSHGLQWQLSADVAQDLTRAITPMGSHNPIATLVSQAHGSYGAIVPTGYQLLDLGEHAMPPAVGSGAGGQFDVRVWFVTATTNMGIATPFIECGGLALWPVGGDNGIMPGGLNWPSAGAAFNSFVDGRLIVDSIGRRITANLTNGSAYDMASAPAGDARIYHQGDYPLVGTAQRLEILPFARYAATPLASSLGVNQPIVNIASFKCGASISYRPRFAFTRGFLG